MVKTNLLSIFYHNYKKDKLQFFFTKELHLQQCAEKFMPTSALKNSGGGQKQLIGDWQNHWRYRLSWIKNKIQLYFVYKRNILDSKIQIDGK